MKKSSKSTNVSPMLSFIIIGLALVLAVYLVNRQINLSPKATVNYQNYQIDQVVNPVNSASDLDAMLNSLDSTDIDQNLSDLELNQNAEAEL